MTQQKVMPRTQESLQSEGDDGENSDNDYKDDDAVAAPAPVLPKDDAQAAFDEIMAKARNRELNLGQKENRQEFLDQYGNILVEKTQTYNQTLLHIIADTLGHKSLTRCIVRKDKKLLEHKDDSGKTALHIAIVKKNYDFLEVVLKEITNLDTILRMRCEHARNCIHIAIYHGLKKESTVNLIKGASEATLSAVDQDGLTPLHLAVEYQRSSEPQLAIVQALITYGDGALDKFTINPKDLSVYEYHQYTRSLAVKLSEPVGSREAGRSHEEPPKVVVQGQKNNPAKSEREGASDYSDADGKGPFQKAIKFDRGPMKEPMGKGPAAPPAFNGRRGSTVTSLALNTMSNHPSLATASEDGMSPIKGSRLATDSAGFEPRKLERRATGHVPRINRTDEESARKLQEEEKRRAEFADKIRQEFKLYYLRSTFGRSGQLTPRDQLNATRFLHGSNIDSK
jgi:ankyrin repeat protein